MQGNHIRFAAAAGSLLLAGICRAAPAHFIRPSAIVANGDIAGSVNDSTSGQPIPSAEVSVTQGPAILANTSTDAFGRFIVHNLPVGDYVVGVHFIGFRATSAHVTVTDGGTVKLAFRLVPATTQLQTVEVSAQTPVAVDTRTGDQVFQQNDYHGAPTNTTTQIIQQSLAGSVRAPTGEVHIRGQHAEYTYYVDGTPVPSGISGSLNELFDPSIVNRIDFQTGGWDAEYGGKNAAVINIQTRVPVGGFHATTSEYAGSFGSFGQSLQLSGNKGQWGAVVSGAGQQTDMRLEPIVADSGDNYKNYHNHGEDYYGFGKIQFTGGQNDIVSVDGNYSRTHFQVPFDSTAGVTNDRQLDQNAFVNMSYHHRFNAGLATDSGAPAEFFAGPFWRHGSLDYTPGGIDQPSFIDAEDPTHTPRTVSEARDFNTFGIKADLSFPIVSGLMDGKVGTLSSATTGHESFQLIDPTGKQPPIQSISNLNGYDVGTYAETMIRPMELIEIRAGLRFDSHVAPFAGNQTQWSPRIRLNLYLDPANTVYLYFGRMFIPTNIEDLRSITAQADSNVITTPTLPERDAFYEGGYIHRFPIGIVAKFSGYRKVSTPGIDDNTIPGSAITTDVNIKHITVTGLEGVVEVRPAGPVSGYVNAAINHAVNQPPVSGGFFPIVLPPTAYFDADHDQRLSIVANALYSHYGFFISTTGIYGSGLTNGITPDSTVKTSVSGQPAYSEYCTGLFCFNTRFKVRPSYIQGVAVGYGFLVNRTVVKPELYFDNIFNDHYILKGAFFSGESVGRPFSMQFRVTVGV